MCRCRAVAVCTVLDVVICIALGLECIVSYEVLHCIELSGSHVLQWVKGVARFRLMATLFKMPAALLTLCCLCLLL